MLEFPQFFIFQSRTARQSWTVRTLGAKPGPVTASPRQDLHTEPDLIELAPSILSADFAHLADQIELAAAGGGSGHPCRCHGRPFCTQYHDWPSSREIAAQGNPPSSRLPSHDRKPRPVHCRFCRRWSGLDFRPSGDVPSLKPHAEPDQELQVPGWRSDQSRHSRRHAERSARSGGLCARNEREPRLRRTEIYSGGGAQDSQAGGDSRRTADILTASK